MSGILRLESLTKGNTLKQGDKTPLKYRLFDADGEKLNIAGKSATVRLVYPDFLTIGYEKDGLTVAQDDTVTFTIDNVIPSRIYHVEIIVDDKFIFPSRADESKFTVDKSSLGTETNIIEIVGKDVLIQEVKTQVDTELQPLVNTLNSAQQAETQRASEESKRVSAEAQRKIDHANRSAELAGKADKVVLDNLIENGNFSDGLTGWRNFRATSVLQDGKALVTADGSGNFSQLTKYPAFNQVKGHIYYGVSSIRLLNSDATELRIMILGNNINGRISNPEQNVDYLLSGLETATTDSTSQHFIPRIMYPSDEIANGKQHVVNFSIAFDLTEIFGVGNEPTKEQMDELIKVTGYIGREYALNNKEMLIWTLALIRRNTSAIVAFGGA